MISSDLIEAIELLADRLATKIVEKQNQPKKFITTQEFMALKGVTKQTVSRWIRNGLPVEKGRPNRFNPEKVDKWLEKHR